MSRRRRRTTNGPTLARWAAVTAGGALLASLVVASGVANAVGNERPAVALRVAPFDARANAREADFLLFKTQSRPDERVAARHFAELALVRDPTVASAYRTLALVGPGGKISEPDNALLLASESMSRREAPTQLALIELHVGRGDVAGALRHYDILLRTAPRYDQLLLPILASAASDPNVERPLARTVVHADLWRRRLLTVMTNVGIDADRYAAFVTTMRRFGPLVDTDIYRSMAGIYADAQRPDAAWRLVEAVDGAATWRAPLRNGRFSVANTTPPFDWALEQGGAVEAFQSGAAGPGRLTITSDRGDGGRAARQLLALAPGRYALSFQTGPLASLQTPVLTGSVTCVATDGASLMTVAVEPRRPTVTRQELAVPSGCPWQWLEFGLRVGRTDSAEGMWLTKVAVTTQPAG